VDQELLYNGILTKVKVDTRKKPNKVYIEENGKLKDIGILQGNQIV